MNKELFRIDIGRITDVIISEDEDVLKIIYAGGELELISDHDQDCCEHVYADFSIMKHYTDTLKGQNGHTLIVKGVEDMGFLLCLADQKIFIPCYNNQNGYYSSQLALKIKKNDVETTIDISDLVEDHID